MSTGSLRARLFLFALATVGLLLPASAHAAKLTQVSGWQGGVSLPSDVTMSIYVPDKLAASPPVITVVHYCGGSAQAVFDQAKDIKAAADKYGFIMIMPAQTHSGGCWDVSSKKAQTHDGGGDTHAIAQMVKYVLAQTQYKANPNRVYSAGDSSGAMMTQLLMAVYPDIFKAGVSFAGVPAGCSNVFDGSGLCGLSAQTAQQWGDRVRAMDPGYTGHRPRLQLIHGDADGTITYKNSTEYIKEWTNVLGLSMDPTTKVDSGLTLGSHQAKRQQWKGTTCDYVVLDFLTSVGGDHGPSDALFQGNFVLPFLGLDSQAAVDAATDPEITKCGGGTGSDGGMPPPDAGVDGPGSDARGGSTGAGGGAGSGSSGSGTGGRGAGGMVGTGSGGSAVGSGGSADGSGGSSGSGGSAPGSGGNSAASGGSSSMPSSGGTQGSQSGGAVGSGGSSSGSGGSGGGTHTSGSGGSSNGNPGGSGGSGCAFAFDASQAGTSAIGLVLPLIVLAFRRKRRT